MENEKKLYLMVFQESNLKVKNIKYYSLSRAMKAFKRMSDVRKKDEKKLFISLYSEGELLYWFGSNSHHKNKDDLTF